MLRLLSVQFDTPLEPWELPAFRGAVAKKAGWEHELFHNHKAETGGFHYRFPLIQYKQDHGRAMLVCLNEGIEELHHFFSQPDWTLTLNGRPAPVRIQRLDVKQYQLGVWEKPFRYHIRQWLALNEENYETYRNHGSLLEKIFQLQQILRNQLVGLLHQLGYTPEHTIEVFVQNLRDERWVSYKGVKVLAFSLEFSCNVALPDYIGIGKGCSTGWGVVKNLNIEKSKIRTREK
ncbi:MAG: hypothetical protein J0L99_20345 [Chitinophagales bacterium]|nr:hypothetical protein [Chitinophagales bacterium]